MTNDQCPMPNAQRPVTKDQLPMPNAQCPSILDCLQVLFPSPNPNNLFYRTDENLAVANLARPGSSDNFINHHVNLIVFHNNLDLELLQELNGVLRTAIAFSHALLTAKTSNFRNSHPHNASIDECDFHFV